MFSVSMPKSRTPSAFVETATKWRDTAASAPSLSSTQRRAVAALVMVSSVVNVFEETMNSVSAASRPETASVKAAPSTLATKRNVIAGSLNGRSA
jgi:hypothetical protein